MDGDELLGRHVFCFNPKDNGGESLILETEFFSTGSPGEVGMSQILTLQSYCNSVSFNLSGASLNPSNLRQLADELEAEQNKARSSTTSE